MISYVSMERAQQAAKTRLSQGASAQNLAWVEWLHEIEGSAVSARKMTLESKSFWRALMTTKDPRPILLHAADLYLAEGYPGWARALIFLTGLSGADSELRDRL